MISTYHEASAMSTSPGSPPELTNSKSSKSSSFQSDDDSGPHDIGNFEDISLEDLQHHHVFPHQEIYTRSISDLDKSPRAMATSLTSMHKLNTQPMPLPHSRDLTSKQSFQPHHRANEHQQGLSLSLPVRRQKKRSPNAANNSFLPRISTNRRSRSTSPISPSHSTFSLNGRSPRSSPRHNGPEPVLPNRRKSWQPGRKTAKELEDEYDSDDELPEDVLLDNVPCSPRPHYERESLSRGSSRPNSGEVSPIALTSKGLGIVMPNPDVAANCVKPLPKSPRHSMATRSVSMTSIPEDYTLNPRSAGKLWNHAMSDLSLEARALTQILETRAEQQEREQEEKIQSGSGSPRKRLSSEKRRVSTSTIELPPLRKNELLVDPNQPSKEKEKFMTRTRPSWLPPKDPEEEKRHLKEYQRMMAQAQEAEARKKKLQFKQQCLRDTTKESLARVWEQHVLPNWDTSTKEPRTRELWWRGITPRDRGLIWQKAVGNELTLSEASYNAALQRAKEAHDRLSKLSPDVAAREQEWQWFEAIKQDIGEAFPELKIFQPGGPLHQTLLNVLMAYAMYRSDIGYVYGTHFIAGLLILNMTATNSFITLSNILNRAVPTAFLTNNIQIISETYTLVLQALAYKLPALHAHLTLPTLNLNPAEYLAPMFQSFFCSQNFGMDIASRIFDVFVFEGDAVLVRAAVGTLARLEGRLYGNRSEILDVLCSNVKGPLDMGQEDVFMETVREMGKIGDKEQAKMG